MAKWIKLNDKHYNIASILSLHSYPVGQLLGKPDGWVVIVNDTKIIFECGSQEQAEQFIRNFIDENYIKTEKVE